MRLLRAVVVCGFPAIMWPARGVGAMQAVALSPPPVQAQRGCAVKGAGSTSPTAVSKVIAEPSKIGRFALSNLTINAGHQGRDGNDPSVDCIRGRGSSC